MIFVDHANVFHNIKDIDGRIDYIKLKEILTGDGHLVAAFMFMGLPKKITKSLRKFINYLKKGGYIIMPIPVEETPEGIKRQKGIDIFMYQQSTELADIDSYDKAVLVSGDGDFVLIIKKLKELDKKIEVWSFKKSFSRKLRREAGLGSFQYIDTILDEIEFQERT